MGCCQSDTRTMKNEYKGLTVKHVDNRYQDQQSLSKIVKIQSYVRGQKDRDIVKQLKHQYQEHAPSTQVAVPYNKAPQTDRIQVQQILDIKYNYPIRNEFKDLVKLPPYIFKITKAVYKGQWLNGKRHGRGIQFWQDGSVYQGEWENDKANGNGRLIHADGDYYEGQWIDDKAQGKGKFVHIDGHQYQGDWIEDLQHGYGIEEQKNFIYEGQFVNGLKHIKGKLTWKQDGSYYEGQFENGIIQGFGTYYYQNGKKYVGNWRYSKMNGYGELYYPNKKIYKGNFENDQKFGQGEMIYPDGKIYIGQWRNNKQNGEGIVITTDGRKGKGFWQDGIRIKIYDDQDYND
ncbi:IQ calmodulin-binding motif family protein, putative [Ichthyophthirius multifiliis]|uniref:IQ calmodulin-binding motif family protein, putative n=1 Tax=Ichthyophthirius multifiliis TaxID=5932 RepID=G0QWG1_ICHMU|nr:IQ calmodulin-binding motif family protein, putative [Ichthyophthirius multifiliis]EGR30444.1 IQ calmodulin-binding motif family protein, putative [Ichthyophthirius multifiliis]|eukprot:XP_004032031.1 IQ calmodulin-binding motif family protein, putative [Ichthyophthirius multifiliis]